jgi:hypothetical protein
VAPGPSAWSNFTSLVRGEVDAAVLEAFRRAGSGVYDLADEVEEKRRLLCLAGRSPWQFPLSFQTELLCSWNALVFQSLGDRLLLDDYQHDPRTVGTVPPPTFDQAEHFYGHVRGWLVAARMAGSSESYRLRTPLPAPLTGWTADASRADRVRVLRPMCDFLLGRLDPVVDWFAALDEHDPKPVHRRTHDVMRQLRAEAGARSEYADELAKGGDHQVVALADEELRDALARLHALGQYAAMPGLLRDRLA